MPTSLLLILPWVLGLIHPFHLSICEIEHDDDSKTLQITSRLFQDDFETALEQGGNADGFFKTTPRDETIRVLERFFEENLQVTVDSKPRNHRLLGFEIEDNVVWCYLEIEKVQSLQEISVKYSVLMDTFDDQINLAHIRYQGEVKSLRFQRNQLTGTAAFTN